MYLAWIAIIVLLVGLLGRRWRHDHRLAFSNRQVASARKLGLSVCSTGRLHGERAGLAIRVRHVKKDDRRQRPQATEVEVMIPSRVPVRFHVVSRVEGNKIADDNFDDKIKIPTLDAFFVVRGDDKGKVSQLLGDLNVTRLLLMVTEGSAWLDLNGRHVRIRCPGDISCLTNTLIDLAAAIALSLARAWHGPWKTWADARSWVINDQGRRIAGLFHGIQIDVQEVTTRNGEIFTRITADIQGGMPGGARIQHIDMAPPDTQPFRRDVPNVHATANQPELVWGMLQDQEVLDAVRWLVINHQGSYVGERRARLLMPGKVVELCTPVARLVGIVQVLTDARCEPRTTRERPQLVGSV